MDDTGPQHPVTLIGKNALSADRGANALQILGKFPEVAAMVDTC